MKQKERLLLLLKVRGNWDAHDQGHMVANSYARFEIIYYGFNIS